MKRDTASNRVSPATKKLLAETKTYPLGYFKDKNRSVKYAQMNLDYDLLRNQYVVRKYFQKKHGIDLRQLEILLYLFPLGYFSHADYKAYPLTFTWRQIKSMIRAGHIKIFQEGENLNKHVYTLTTAAKHKVISYYKLLCGEIPIPTISENNPMIRKDATPHEKKIISMFHRLKKQAEDKKEKDQEQ